MQKSAVFGAILGVASIAPFTAVAQTTLELINEYPASSITGEADAFFANAVKARTGGRVTIHLLPNAESKLRTREQLKAVTEGRFAMATSFGGALAAESPVFLMSSLPFVTPTTRDQRALYEAARTQYEALFAERKQKLLYAVPWPASGIWSATPLTGAETLKTLKIRTYDKTSTDVLASVAASATLISFNDLNPKLESGELNAVLSSGDGGAGRGLWKYLRHFSAVGYAAPLSFTSISLDAWEKLDDTSRKAFEEAARETYARQWPLLDERVAQNYARMRENGVTIDENPPAGVMAALRESGKGVVAQWTAAATPAAQDALKSLQRAKP
jgi:TRAP-type C4-dicarboxylate transport system substrate-binding protein